MKIARTLIVTALAAVPFVSPSASHARDAGPAQVQLTFLETQSAKDPRYQVVVEPTVTVMTGQSAAFVSGKIDSTVSIAGDTGSDYLVSVTLNGTARMVAVPRNARAMATFNERSAVVIGVHPHAGPQVN